MIFKSILKKAVTFEAVTFDRLIPSNGVEEVKDPCSTARCP